ncbi:MAG: hypothetical protein ACSLEN_06470 [Candidatus Malihini olakiniferum]
MYASSYAFNGGSLPDQETGLRLAGVLASLPAHTNWMHWKPIVRGDPFELMGRQHELVAGVGYSPSIITTMLLTMQ